jgi:peptidyl-prolyl cis-trans isomerase SurA
MVRLVSLALGLALSVIAGAARAQAAVEPVVVVNDVVVTTYDVEQRARLLVVNGAPQDQRLRGAAIDQLVDDAIKRAAAGRRDARVTAESLEGLVSDYAAARNLSVTQLEGALARAGVERKTLEDALSSDAIWRDTVRARFGPRAEPSDAEIDQEIELSSGGVTEYRLAEIGLPNAGRGEAETRALAQRLARELAGGADFAAAARTHSASPTAGRGGEIGWTPETALPGPVLEALAATQPGGVAGPLPVTGGLALLKVLDRRRSEAAAGGSVTLLAIRSRAGRRGADRERIAGLLAGDPGCDAAEAAAREAGLAVERSAAVAPASLPPSVQGAIAGRAAGRSTDAFATDDGAVGFVVCERSDTVSPEQREAIRSRLRNQRLVRFAASWLEELRGDAVIERR